MCCEKYNKVSGDVKITTKGDVKIIVMGDVIEHNLSAEETEEEEVRTITFECGGEEHLVKINNIIKMEDVKMDECKFEKFNKKVDAIHEELNSKIDNLGNIILKIIEDAGGSLSEKNDESEMLDDGAIRLKFYNPVEFETSCHREGFEDFLSELLNYDECVITGRYVTLTDCTPVMEDNGLLTPEFIGVLYHMTLEPYGLSEIMYNGSNYVIEREVDGNVKCTCSPNGNEDDIKYTSLPDITRVILECETIPYDIIHNLSMRCINIELRRNEDIVKFVYAFRNEYEDIVRILKKVDEFDDWLDVKVNIFGKTIQVY